ncbi:uncharacterized protein N7477_000869 [Penicillium maclennaniae]|uniref:uncharacterized protein n=1 Tax=Penicillium maclennaniae TaxID=1343394 RepID=UPI00253FA975|nr:uncharacterized protein N7477_000869 [Penicillium maclennaniae]KAJ5684524.1 hypothetical protein N7477_000869 [Penicillium maclennaniae]
MIAPEAENPLKRWPSSCTGFHLRDYRDSIVGVPPIGGHPEKTWTDQGSRSPWLGIGLLKRMPRARVLLYNHGPLHENDRIEDLGQRLLNHLLHERKSESTRRPLFFMCHSTGGLVAKACLALASRAEPNQQTILTSCYGIAFFATPHQGSSYLSAEEYSTSIRRLLHLEQEIPSALREQFRPRQERLWHLSNQFKTISADMKVWSFLETIDSTLHVLDVETQNVMVFHAPITSIRSGLLTIEHEIEHPLATDHAGTACFRGQASSLEKFLVELSQSVTDAVRLSKNIDTHVNVESDVIVQVNGFFEDTALGVSDETPLKLWTARVSLEEYLTKGPSECLRDRLKRSQPAGLDNSSVSSFDSPRHSFPHVIPSPEELGHKHDHNHGTAHNESDGRPLRPTLSHGESFDSVHSPAIHITVPHESEYFESHESPPPPAERPRNNSITRALGFNTLKPHQRRMSDGSSYTSGSRLSSSGSPQQQSRFLSIPPSTSDRINDHGETRDIPRSVPRFDRPEPDTEKLLWIHVPYTHTGWVSQVIRRACHDRQEPNFLRKFINDENWYLNLNRARHLEPHARFVRPKCIHARQRDASQPNKSGTPEDPQLALYTPYLHWDTYRNLIQRRKVVEDRLKQGRSHPVPSKIAKSSQEAQLIWQYLGCEPPIHFRRTLDQYGYPNLRSTVARDDDQMLWKRTRRPVRLDDQLRSYMQATDEDPEDPERTVFMDGNVLMVDQLWLWIVDQKTIVTFFPNQEATTSEGKLLEQTNLHSSIYNELNGDLARRFETAGDLAALIMLHAVTVLLDKTLHHDLQVLRIFEESISILTESVTKSFKRFRNGGFTNGPADYNLTASGRPMSAIERNERDRKIALRNREDLSVLLELRDIEDELATILRLLDQQDGVIKSMMKYFDIQGCGKVFLDAAQLRIDEYRTQISEMKENSHLAQKAVETLLDLKQKQANVDEAKIARWQAEATQNQSRSVMVFTIFTVIFLPLSFFTSLFGINASEWSGVSSNLTLVEMLEIAAPASIAIIVLSLLLAFSERLRQAMTKSQKISYGLFKDFFLLPIERFLHLDTLSHRIPSTTVSEDSAMRKRFDHYLGYESHSTKHYEDFWQMREHERSPLAKLERKAKKKSHSHELGEAIELKVRGKTNRFVV